MPQDQVKLKKSGSSHGEAIGSDNSDHFPFGTSLRFEDDLTEELGIENLAVGDIVEVRGFAFVERKSEHSDTDGVEKGISIQFTTLKLQRETGDRAEQLYGPNS